MFRPGYTWSTGARVAEVPEAFPTMLALDHGVIVRDQPSTLNASQGVFAQAEECPRWRLTLDRPVTLRGKASGRIVRTETLYVARRTDAAATRGFKSRDQRSRRRYR